MKVISLILAFQFCMMSMPKRTFGADNEFFMEAGVSEEPVFCLAEEQLEDEQITCHQSSDEGPLDQLMSDGLEILGDQINGPISCSDEHLKDSGYSDDGAELKNRLQEICYEQFKKHKRQFAWQLLKKGRVFKSLGVLLKRKKKYAKVKRVINNDLQLKAEGENIHELNAQIMKEEERILKELRDELGETEEGELLLKEADALYEDNGNLLKPNYCYQLSSSNKIGAVFLETSEGYCKVEVQRPKVDASEKDLNSLYPPLDLLNSFPDDCAIMYNDKFKFEDALALVGARSRSEYCSTNQKLDNKLDDDSPAVTEAWLKTKSAMNETLNRLDEISGQFVIAANKKMTPEFVIQTTRNLYADQVKPLAEKRAEFIRRYVFKQIEKAKIDGLIENAPDWTKSYADFEKVMKINHPKYEGMSSSEQPGSYGPNPLAKKENQAKEIENLRHNLNNRKDDYLNSLKDMSRKEVDLNRLLNDTTTGIVKRIAIIEKEISGLERKINKSKFVDLKDLEPLKLNYQEKLKSLAQLSYEKVENEQKLNEARQMKTYLNKKISDLDIDKTVADIKQFYTNRPENYNNGSKEHWDYKKSWDTTLFNKFKMAQLEGNFEGPIDVDQEFDLDDFNPKIKYLIEKNIEMQGFQCDYKLSDIKRSSLRYRRGTRNSWRHLWNIPAVGFAWTVITPISPVLLLGKWIGHKLKYAGSGPCNRSKFRFNPWGYAKRKLSIKKRGSKGRWYHESKSPIVYEDKSNDDLLKSCLKK